MKNFRPLTVPPNNVNRCPVCGARWLKGNRDEHGFMTEFECGGVFTCASRKVSVESPCPAPSDIAAMALTQEQRPAEVT
jgi:hypothetical protein